MSVMILNLREPMALCRAVGVITMAAWPACTTSGLSRLAPPAGEMLAPARTETQIANGGAKAREPDAAPADAEEMAEQSRLHLTLGLDVTTAYFFRGYRYEDSGLIAQPYADFAFDLFQAEPLARGGEVTISFTMGIWNSIQSEATDAGTDDDVMKYWYESDLYAGVLLETERWSLEARYFFYLSPSDAWETVEEVYVSAEYDDSAVLATWSLSPYACIAIETGNAATDGGRPGTYMELGISPGFSLGPAEDVELSFPLAVGLSLSNYYEGDDGENDVFGFASIGVAIAVPLFPNAAHGAWSFDAGVQALILGDATSAANDDQGNQIIATAGISVEF